MRLSAAAFFMILTTIFLSACDTAKTASVEDRGNNFYSRNGVVSLAQMMNHASAGPTVQSAPIGSISSRDLTPAQSVSAPLQTASASWQWPVQGKVTETFGHKSDGIANEGIVISAAEGTPIAASRAGEVAFVGKDTKTYGNIVILRHPDGDMTSYAHAQKITVTKGQKVVAGGMIGTVGQSGSAKSPQLHFAVRENNSSVDPLSKLPHQLALN